jgi:hypothetical protein
VYPDPFSYNPDRFLKDGQLDKTVRDPTVAFFGFGRRICPGRFLSQNSMFILIAHILTVFDIRPAVDEEGNEMKIKPRMTSGFISCVHCYLFKASTIGLTITQSTGTQSLLSARSHRGQRRLKY